MLFSNSHYQIGNSHKFCEDFAVDSIFRNNGTIVVCDGCSSSGINLGMRRPINVDFGSRVIAILIQQTLNELESGNLFQGNVSDIKFSLFQSLFPKIRTVYSTMNISYNSLDCTAMIAGMNTKNMGGVFLVGDGVVVLGYSEYWDIYLVEYSENAPCYLSYHLDNERMNFYKDNFFEQKLFLHQTTVSKDFKEILSSSIKECAIDQPIFINLVKNDNSGLCKEIILCSDGIESFKYLDSGIDLDYLDVLEKIIPFPSIKGEFIAKRFNVLKRWMKKEGICHSDDLAIAALASK